jgi:hypothetical protein
MDGNQHEIQARLQKALRLADGFDRLSQQLGAEGSEIPTAAEAYERDSWNDLAVALGLNPPSDVTVQLVISCLRYRYANED